MAFGQCVVCSTTDTGLNDDGLCPRCQAWRQRTSEPAKLVLSHEQMFGDMDRERDNIVWFVPRNTTIWPIYSVSLERLSLLKNLSLAFVKNENTNWNGLGLVQNSTRLEREFYCHDDNLHQLRHLSASLIFNAGLLEAALELGLLSEKISSRARLEGRSQLSYLWDQLAAGRDQLYAYQFHKAISDSNGWVIGFLVDGENLFAHNVDFEDIEDADVLTPAA